MLPVPATAKSLEYLGFLLFVPLLLLWGSVLGGFLWFLRFEHFNALQSSPAPELVDAIFLDFDETICQGTGLPIALIGSEKLPNDIIAAPIRPLQFYYDAHTKENGHQFEDSSKQLSTDQNSAKLEEFTWTIDANFELIKLRNGFLEFVEDIRKLQNEAEDDDSNDDVKGNDLNIAETKKKNVALKVFIVTMSTKTRVYGLIDALQMWDVIPFEHVFDRVDFKTHAVKRSLDWKQLRKQKPLRKVLEWVTVHFKHFRFRIAAVVDDMLDKGNWDFTSTVGIGSEYRAEYPLALWLKPLLFWPRNAMQEAVGSYELGHFQQQWAERNGALVEDKAFAALSRLLSALRKARSVERAVATVTDNMLPKVEGGNGRQNCYDLANFPEILSEL